MGPFQPPLHLLLRATFPLSAHPSHFSLFSFLGAQKMFLPWQIREEVRNRHRDIYRKEFQMKNKQTTETEAGARQKGS